MKKTPSIIFVIAVFYVLPLLGRAAFIIHPQMLFLMLACSLLFWTQPAISLNEAEAQKPADQSSVFWILIATSLSQIAAVVEWAYFHEHRLTTSNLTLGLTGMALLISGIAFRLWAIQVLGKYFTATVQVQNGQKIKNSQQASTFGPLCV